MDGRSFVKFLRDARLLTKNCTQTADLIFAKVKPRGSHTIAFQGFITCLNEVAKRKNVRFEKLVDHILSTVQGPKKFEPRLSCATRPISTTNPNIQVFIDTVVLLLLVRVEMEAVTLAT